MPGSGCGISVTIWHDGQFFVAFCERWGPEGRAGARYVFGPEPSLPEVASFVNSRAFLELPFLALGDVGASFAPPGNPKRRQREAARPARTPATSTRSQAALQAALDERNEERRSAGRRRRAEEADERYLRRQAKRREKRRGH